MTALDDRAAITDLLVRYCRGVDHLDRELLASVYHPDATDRHGGFQGGVAEFLDWVLPALTARFDATMHSVSNVVVDLDPGDPDRARSVCDVRADHLISPSLGGGVFHFWGSYVDVHERRGGEWRILRRLVVKRFTQVTPAATGNGGGFRLSEFPYLTSTRSPADPTFWDAERIAKESGA